LHTVLAVVREAYFYDDPMKNRQAKLIKLDSVKPRNPVAVPAAKRKAGSHQKSSKAVRRAERIAHEQAMKTGGRNGKFGDET
jgi:hypothetical protein